MNNQTEEMVVSEETKLAYDGDKLTEVLARVRRVEIRNAQFMRWNGFNPSQRVVEEADHRISVEYGSIMCSSPAVTVGDMLRVANEQQMTGKIDVFLGDRRVGSLYFGRNADD